MDQSVDIICRDVSRSIDPEAEDFKPDDLADSFGSSDTSLNEICGADLTLRAEIDRIRDVNTLQDLCLEVIDLTTAESLTARLAEVIESTT